MTKFDIPGYFAAFITAYFGDRGAAWLIELPSLLARCAYDWELHLLPPFAGLSFNYVAPVLRTDGSPAVLKVGVPEEEARTGIAFLRLCRGEGTAHLFEADDENCALVMERASPGIPLARLDDDDAATRIAGEVMRTLWHPVPDIHAFIPLARRLQGLARLQELRASGGPLADELLSRAEALPASCCSRRLASEFCMAICTTTTSSLQGVSPGWQLIPKAS